MCTETVLAPVKPGAVVEHFSVVVLEAGEFADAAEASFEEVAEVEDVLGVVEEVNSEAIHLVVLPFADVAIPVAEDADPELILDGDVRFP